MSWDEITKGTSGSDIINGGSGDDFLQGRAGGDFLDGGDGDDQLHGDAGDDFVRGGAGNDLLHGGLGTDTAVYSGSIFDYSFGQAGDEFFVNHSGGSMIDGYDRLIGIERLVFADAVVDLTQNNGPIAFADFASTDEDVGTYSSGSASVLDNDFDWENNTLAAVGGTFNGAYGTLVLNSDGTYTYTPYASAQALALGQTVQDSFSYSVTDGSLSGTGTLTITVAGRNDAPVAIADAAATSENAPVSIDVLANDTDVDNGATLTVTAAAAPAGQGSVSVAANQVVFDPGTDFDHLDTGETAEVVVSYTITDEHGATSSSTVTITVDGANDAPVANDDTASTAEDASVSGNVLADDTDADGEALTVANAGVYAGAYGTLTLNADGSYSYAPNAAAQGLDDGETAQDVFAYTASDGTASDSATLTVTVGGANDAPVANDDSASTDEDTAVSGNVLANDTDADGEALTVGNPGTYNGAYGTLTLNADGSYTYTPGAAAQALNDGETVQDSFAYFASDGTASEPATLTVTITGADDGPQTVWYIDNSAVGSTNVGTQANPFTSIAAFNAAQGTVDGPKEGATVYLLQGTGTYAEADGINLLDDQILIGVGRPNIAPVSGNGIDLAEDNNISGVDITVAAGNAGIEDDGGSVGNLVISDVAVAGSGQIVDIDDGGTLNVSLTSAASTESVGGAIDLNGVGGSFTVTGVTTISGTSGGGVDITSGMDLAADFQGGLAASTGADTAVNFHGNAGSSSLAVNGLNLVTTTGTGLDAANGGTVTVSGAANTVATTGGTAVSITFATIGAGGVTFSDVTSIGGTAAGIVLDTAGSGGFSVGGGTIANKAGAAGISINATSDVSLANMAITGNSNGGVLGTNVNNFSLTGSTLTGNGSSGSQGAVYFTGLTGTADLLGNIIGGSSGDNVHIVQTGGALDLEIADNGSSQAIMGSVNNVTGNDSVYIGTAGTASLNLRVDGVDFQGALGDLLQVVAGDRSTQTVVISNNGFHDAQAGAGGGVTLGGGGPGSDIDVTYAVVGNSFTGAHGSALSALYNQEAGDVRGHIGGNTIGVADSLAGSQGSATGDGIRAGLEKTGATGTATYTVTIVDNDIHDIASGSGISVTSGGGGAGSGAVMEAALAGNTVAEMGDFSFAAFYAMVGGSAFSGDYSQLGLDIQDNEFTAGAFGLSAYFDQLSTDAHYYFPGYGGSGQGEFANPPGTATVGLEAFLTTTNGNVLVGPMDAGFVDGVTGAQLMLAPYFYP